MVKTINMSSFPSYIFFWIGQLVSIFGSIVVFFSLNFWLSSTTGSAIAITIGSLSFLIPSLLTLLVGGVVADNYDRKKVILLVGSIQASSIFTMWLLFTFNFLEFWMLYFFFAIRAVCQAFHIPTEFAIIPTMVPKKHLSRINGIAFVAIGFIQIIGPLVGSRLLVFHSIKQILWIDIITFTISIVPLILVKIPSVKKKQGIHELELFGKQFRTGFKALITVPGLLVLMIQILIFSFLILPFNTTLALYITSVHMGSPPIIQLIFISSFIGIFIGGIIAAIKGTWAYKTPIISLMIVIHGITYALFVFIPIGNFILMIIYSIIGGLTMSIIYAIFFTILQTSVLHEKVGRIFSIYNTLSSGINYIGVTVSGYLVEFFGMGLLFFICAILYLIITILIFFFTGLQNLII
ncbi:MAG: MFS transporter [Promethearchaeota archaeon]